MFPCLGGLVLPGSIDPRSADGPFAEQNDADAELPGDADLMLRFQRGDEAAYEILVRRHLAFVIRHARRYLAEDAGAEDVAQEVFLRLYRSGLQFRDPSNFTGWLATMTTRLALNELRTRARKRWLPRSQLKSDGATDSTAGREWRPGMTAPGSHYSTSSSENSHESGEETLLRAERAAAVRAAVANLPERQRLAIELQRFEDFDLEQIGVVLEMTVPAVKSLLHRARATLLEALSPYLDGESGTVAGEKTAPGQVRAEPPPVAAVDDSSAVHSPVARRAAK